MADGCESKLSSCTLFPHWKSRKRCISSCLACVIHDFGVNRRLAIGVESFIYTFFSFFLYLYFCLAKRKKVVGRRLPPTFFLFAWTGLFFFESFFFDETCARYVVSMQHTTLAIVWGVIHLSRTRQKGNKKNATKNTRKNTRTTRVRWSTVLVIQYIADRAVCDASNEVCSVGRAREHEKKSVARVKCWKEKKEKNRASNQSWRVACMVVCSIWRIGSWWMWCGAQCVWRCCIFEDGWVGRCERRKKKEKISPFLFVIFSKHDEGQSVMTSPHLYVVWLTLSL